MVFLTVGLDAEVGEPEGTHEDAEEGDRDGLLRAEGHPPTEPVEQLVRPPADLAVPTAAGSSGVVVGVVVAAAHAAADAVSGAVAGGVGGGGRALRSVTAVVFFGGACCRRPCRGES